jgi:hypothetical protein
MSPLLYKRRILAAQIEDAPGQVNAGGFADADAAIVTFDAKIAADIPFEERQGPGSLSPLAGAFGGLKGQCTFETEILGLDGTIDPFWARVLLPACGFPGAAHVFAPLSESPGTNVKTLTLGLYQDGILNVLRGCAGNPVFRFTSGRPVRVAWTFQGIWDAPVGSNLPDPTYPTEAPLRFVSSGLLIGSWAPKISEMTLDFGNEITVREDSADSSGYDYAVISGRRIRGTMNPEAALVGVKNLYQEWIDRTTAALSIGLGTAGNAVSFDAPELQFTKIEGAERGGIATESLEFQLNRDDDAGDDELSITIA